MKRFAKANWKGTGKEGKGMLSTQSGLFSNAPYSYGSRFENASGTNPEELIAAAHAGCFSMKLSFNLTKEGFPPANIDTRCEITLDPDKGIVESRLTVEAKVPGIDKNKFQELVEHAKINCPVSKLLNTSIVCEAELTA